MSFVSAVRDYVEILNSISSNITVKDWLLETFFYVLKTLQYSFLYVISFQWIRDFTLLPIIVPQITKSILKEGPIVRVIFVVTNRINPTTSIVF